LLATGCSSSPPPLAEVSGKLTMNGKPLGNVKVTFHPDPDQGTRGPGSVGTTNADGTFTLTFPPDKAGALVGHHRVILTDLDTFGTKFVGRAEYVSEDPKGAYMETPKKPRFPEAYGDLARTPVRVELKPGPNPVTIDVKK
jgi:hypothetical protein